MATQLKSEIYRNEKITFRNDVYENTKVIIAELNHLVTIGKTKKEAFDKMKENIDFKKDIWPKRAKVFNRKY